MRKDFTYWACLTCGAHPKLDKQGFGEHFGIALNGANLG